MTVTEKRTELRLPREFATTVGIHADSGNDSHGEDTVIGIAEKHEFGLGVPQRSFLRRWADEDADQIDAVFQAELPKLLEGADETVIGERIALKLQGLAQAFLSDGRAQPPNAQSTIDEKGSSTPLIDEGRLRQAILGRTEVVL